MSNLASLTAAQFKRAAEIKEKIDALQAELAGLLGGTAANPGGKGKFSAAGLARLRAAQKARWARVRAAQPAATVRKARRNMSPEGRARIIAGQKARWAKVKAAQAGK